MPRRFPLPLTVGTDICHIKRIYKILIPPSVPPVQDHHGDAFLSTAPRQPQEGGIAKRGKRLIGRLIGMLTGTALPPNPDVKHEGSRPVPEDERGKRFIHKVLTPQEIAEGIERGRLNLSVLETRPLGNGERGRIGEMARFLGGRWAAKEAVMKAFPARNLSFHDIIIRTSKLDGHQGSKAPMAVISKSRSTFMQEVPISISHDGNYATAVALGFNGFINGSHRERSEPSNESTKSVKDVTGTLESKKVLDSLPSPCYGRSSIDEHDIQCTQASSLNTTQTSGDPAVMRSETQRPMEKNHDTEMMTIRVSNIKTSVKHSFILSFFAQRYPSLRWITMDKSPPSRGKISSKSATLTFSDPDDYNHALRTTHGMWFEGTKLEATRVPAETSAPSDERLRTLNPHYDAFSGHQLSNAEAQAEMPSEAPPVRRLRALQSIFQDDVRVARAMRYAFGGPCWDTDEIIRTAAWDAIAGEPVRPVELRESAGYEDRWRAAATRGAGAREARRRDFVRDAGRLKAREDWAKMKPLLADFQKAKGASGVVRRGGGFSIRP